MKEEKIGKIIKELREKNNLTQKEFADMFNVTFQAVSKWERGLSIPDITILKEMCDKYSLDINVFLDGTLKKDKSKLIKILIATCIPLVLIVIIFILVSNPHTFEFKTLKSDNSKFEIEGVAAYSKDKKSLYISSINYMDKDDISKYKVLECTLYEENNDTVKTISKCTNDAKDKSLNELLKSVYFKVDDFSNVCRHPNDLYIKVEAMDESDKKISYTIPLTLDDNCAN